MLDGRQFCVRLPLAALENQLEEALFSAISEEKSLHRLRAR